MKQTYVHPSNKTQQNTKQNNTTTHCNVSLRACKCECVCDSVAIRMDWMFKWKCFKWNHKDHLSITECILCHIEEFTTIYSEVVEYHCWTRLSILHRCKWSRIPQSIESNQWYFVSEFSNHTAMFKPIPFPATNRSHLPAISYFAYISIRTRFGFVAIWSDN